MNIHALGFENAPFAKCFWGKPQRFVCLGGETNFHRETLFLWEEEKRIYEIEIPNILSIHMLRCETKCEINHYTAISISFRLIAITESRFKVWCEHQVYIFA